MALPVLKGSSDGLVGMRRSELSDQVSKMNRQEEKMLQRRLKLLRKQERVAEHLMNRDILDAERLRGFITDQSGRAINLNQYDSRKSTHKSSNHVYGVKFPPLQPHPYMTSSPRPAAPAVALSRRALKHTDPNTEDDVTGSSEAGHAHREPIVVHLRHIRYTSR